MTTTTALLYRMIIAVMAGDQAATHELYDEYVEARRLHVTVAEMLEAKRETA